MSYSADYRVYDHGLHLGIPHPSVPCHIENDSAQFALKSHLTVGAPDGMGDWYLWQHGHLSHHAIQVCDML